MKSIMVLACLGLLVGGCVDVSLKREKGLTKDGYTSYRTTLHAEVIDEPVCQGTCTKLNTGK